MDVLGDVDRILALLCLLDQYANARHLGHVNSVGYSGSQIWPTLNAYAYYPSKYACQCPDLFHRMIKAWNLRPELILKCYLIKTVPFGEQETVPFLHLSCCSLTQYLLILSTCSVLGAVHSAMKTKRRYSLCLHMSAHPPQRRKNLELQTSHSTLHCLLGSFVAGTMFMVTW